MRTRVLALIAVVAAINCSGKEQELSSTDSVRAATHGQLVANAERDACTLLAPDEVTAIVEHPIAAGKRGEGEPGLSVCDWHDRDGLAVFQLKVYWRRGREMWNIWRTAQGVSEEMLKKAEGVGLDSIVKQGPVAGIGDAAYFSELLPSLVLKDDVLIEITNPIGKRPATKFRGMTEKILSRI